MTTPFSQPPRVTDWHRAGEAVVYVRQSSLQQVRDHTGSAAHQRAQVEHLRAMGWPDTSIRVVDDQGRSGTTTSGRPALKELTADVASGRVRTVAMSEISRMGRNDLELQGFLVLCEQRGVLLLDNGIPRDLREVGDWMLVNLLSVISEGENRRKTQRCQTARRAKALQGFPVTSLPAGLERAPDGSAVKVQDVLVREVLGRVWREALEGRSLGEIGRGLVADGKRIPIQDTRGRGKWGQVTREGLHKLLTNPTYAGQVALCRYRTVRESDRKRLVRVRLEEQEWVPGKIEPYVSVEEFHRVQGLLRARARPQRVPTGDGAALCPGLIYCGQCGGRLHVHYAVAGPPEARHPGRHFYDCGGQRMHGHLGNACISVGGRLLDHAIEEVVLRALQPPTAANLRRAIREENERRHAGHRVIAAELRQAETKVADTRAFLEESRRDLANPRVTQMYADELDAALRRLDEIQRRATTTAPPALLDMSAQYVADLAAAFQALPELWRSGRLGPRERKAIVGQVIQRIEIGKRTTTAPLRITLHSGVVIEQQLFNARARRELTRHLALDEGLTPRQIVAEFQRRGIWNHRGEPVSEQLVRMTLKESWRAQQADLHTLLTQLWADGLSKAKIAAALNAQGFRNTLGDPWTDQTVGQFARRNHLPARWQRHRDILRTTIAELFPVNLSNAELAHELNRRGLTTYRGTPWTPTSVSHTRRALLQQSSGVPVGATAPVTDDQREGEEHDHQGSA